MLNEVNIRLSAKTEVALQSSKGSTIQEGLHGDESTTQKHLSSVPEQALVSNQAYLWSDQSHMPREMHDTGGAQISTSTFYELEGDFNISTNPQRECC